jgi:1,4-dihydroxy-2-naphthoyl-CoA hydrolase
MWWREYSLNELNQRGKDTAVHHLGIEILELGSNFIRGKMPVDQRTIQPAGILHGGSSVLLAETLGSLASNLILDPNQYVAVGMEVNANHLRPVSSGYVIGTATIIHKGKSSHIWSIEIRNDKGELNCISRLTMAVILKPQPL